MTGGRFHGGGIGLHGDTVEGIELRLTQKGLEEPHLHNKDQDEPWCIPKGFKIP